MNILIKGIDMPNKIDLDFHDNHIVLGGVLYPIDIDQLVYIPTPHGRLIDGDELIEHISKDPLFDLVERYGVSGVIESRPTILEEEK